MLGHYLTVAWRALFADRFFALVNLLGLAVGLAAVSFIFLYVKNEFSYDRWLPRHETLFRVDMIETTPGRDAVHIARVPGPLADALQRDFPQITGVARAYATSASVVRNAQPFSEDILVADPNFISLLGPKFVAGAPDRALDAPSRAALSARAAEKYFGQRDPVGQRLTILVPEPRDFVVSAVFETLPPNSHMTFDIVVPFGSYFSANSTEIMAIPDHWGGAYFHTYIRLKDEGGAAAIEPHLLAFIDRHAPQWLTDALKAPPHEFFQFRLVPVRDVHFDGGSVAAMKPPASRTTVASVAMVAVLILLIASINFANLTMARSTLRTREVALRKIVGASRRHILIQFMGEAFVLTLAAWVLALVIVELTLPFAGRLLELPAELPLPSEVELALGLALLVAVTATGAGFYPSLVVSRIRPAAALGRDRGRSSGGGIRSLLAVAQFAISIALIAITIVMLLQNRYAREVDLGFDRENLLILRLPDGEQRAAVARSLKQVLARRGEVIDVALSSAVPSDPSEDNISVRVPSAAKPLQLGYHVVDSDFFRTYGVTPLNGRTASMRQLAAPTEGGGGEQTASAVINQSALRRLGFIEPVNAVGQVVRTAGTAFTIVGVVPDLHFRSLHAPVRDEIYVLDDDAGGVLSVRYRTDDLPGFLAAVDRLWAERLPNHPADRTFLDEALDSLYASERRQALLVGTFSGVAIMLSCLGLLAMTAFAVQRRTREIGIRKVLGARGRDVVRLLLWQFCKPVLLANLIAWPVAWLVLNDWLSRFAYRIEMPLSAFIAAGLASLVIAWAAVATHTARVARTSPVSALRYE